VELEVWKPTAGDQLGLAVKSPWCRRYAYTEAGIGAEKTGPLFRTLGGRGRKQLGAKCMSRQDARRMIVRRALQAGIITKLGCHTFRATGITVYLLNGGLLEYAQQMAAHESARTTKLYDRRNDQITLDQVERIIL
jgi:integrase/recombinase XerD